MEMEWPRNEYSEEIHSLALYGVPYFTDYVEVFKFEASLVSISMAASRVLQHR